MADRIESNGSFYVSKGTFNYVGQKPADIDQVVTFDYDSGEVTSTDLSKLRGDACVSQYESDPPSTRPRGAELQIGDLWTDKESKFIYIWDGKQWVFVKTINGNPVGTIIQNIQTDPLAAPPAGYLLCDGTQCPPEYEELLALLFEVNGNTLLPNLGGGFFIKY